jgi:hypothetical protein
MLRIPVSGLHRALNARGKSCRPVRVSEGEIDVPQEITGSAGGDPPPADTRRWVASRKAAVIRAVLHGLITQAEAERRYGLSEEEFREWVRAYSQQGMKGLRATGGKV